MSLRWRPCTIVLALGLLAAAPSWAQAEDETSTQDTPALEESPEGDDEGPAGPEELSDELARPDHDEIDDLEEPEFYEDDDEGIDDEEVLDEVEAEEATPNRAGTIVASPGVLPRTPPVSVRSNDEVGTGPWRLSLGGYMRMKYTAIDADPEVEFFGRNDGFIMADARSTMIGELDNGLGFVFQLDGASSIVPTEAGSPVRELAMRMTDTYIFYTPLPFLALNVGQFKVPFDAEQLLSVSNLLFIDRSVGSRGVRNVEGFNVDGLSFDRELGLRAQGTYFFTADPGVFEGPGFSYAMALTNGHGANRSLNNNSRFAYYGRLGLHWGEYVALGGAYMINDDTLGQPPNRVERLIRSWTADVQASVAGVTFLASVINRRTISPDLPQEPEVESLAYQAQIGYEEPFFGLQPAYRFANYDPTYRYPGEQIPDFEGDALTYHTLGLNYNARTYPIRMMANYTITLEEARRQLDNNRFDLLLQLEW